MPGFAKLLITASLALAVAACVSTAAPKAPEKLYFAVELRRDGELVGKPKLLGETGKPLRVERRQQGATLADYELRLLPERDGGQFKVELDAAVRDAGGHQELALLHGQEKKLQLGRLPGELEISLTLMKVDSPEFRTLMGLVESEPKQPSSI
ncbi:MAG: hypothetical protein ACT4TC_25220 [Myxococcaceae bacterium]